MLKESLRSTGLKVAAVVLAFSFGLSAYAAPPREELVHAYRLLQHANSNYNGHRVAAMNEVSAAGRDLGLDLGGDLTANERQWHSDEQLKEARHILNEARRQLDRGDRERVSEHLDRAVREIDEALRVK